MEILQKNQISYIHDELHHPILGKIGITLHVKQRLLERQRLSIRDFVPYFHNMKVQRGDRRCEHLRVIDQKIAKSTYPMCDYLYMKALNLAIVVSRIDNNMVTCLDLNNDYYQPNARY